MEPTLTDDVRDLTADMTRNWWVFLISGVAWIVFAFVVLSFDFASVWAIAVFLGFGLLAGGAITIMMGLTGSSWRWLHVAYGVIAIIGGLFALAWPGQTFLVLAAIIGWYVLFTGMLDIAMAFSTRDDNDVWWLQLVVGIAEVLVGFWAVSYEGRSITLLVVWVGASALARGISSLFIAFGLHGAGRELRRRMAGRPLPPPTPVG